MQERVPPSFDDDLTTSERMRNRHRRPCVFASQRPGDHLRWTTSNASAVDTTPKMVVYAWCTSLTWCRSRHRPFALQMVVVHCRAMPHGRSRQGHGVAKRAGPDSSTVTTTCLRPLSSRRLSTLCRCWRRRRLWRPPIHRACRGRLWRRRPRHRRPL